MDNKDITNLFKIGVITLASATIATVTTLWYRQKNFKPKAAKPISPFDLESCLGKWYIVARINHRQERNLSNATSEILRTEEDRLIIINRGYNYVKNKWIESKAEILNTGEEDKGTLEVSYFGPLTKFYNVIAIEGEYDFALVVGRDTGYCWFLSRTPEIPEEVRAKFVMKAKGIGVKVNELFWVDHCDEPLEDEN